MYYSLSFLTNYSINRSSIPLGIALSAVHYGQIVMQLPGGWLVTRIGGWKVLLIGIFLSSLSTIFQPLAAMYNFTLFVVLRVFAGLCQTPFHAAVNDLWSRWASPQEITRFSVAPAIGETIGSFMTIYFSGYVLYYFSWPTVFYICGATGIIWTMIWCMFFTNSPSIHTFISYDEAEYIQTTIEDKQGPLGYQIPWSSILCSRPIWALALGSFGLGWLNSMLIAYFPILFYILYDKKIYSIGLLSCIPFFLHAVFMLLFSILADKLIQNHFSKTATRNAFLLLGSIVPAGSLMLMTYSSDQGILITALYLIVIIEAAMYCTIMANPLDIAPIHVGIITAFIDIFSSLASAISPLIAGFIIEPENIHSWHTVFYEVGAVLTACSLIYLMYSSAEIQPWAVYSLSKDLTIYRTLNSDEETEETPISSIFND
ncbi:uncharacterized protein TRIADDRAFT_18643 [Trichoplax adhaerens]|uniref:Major facilitator superfamily (MFS) profile domain-containing protein n=1 Tax=Trichoplax adhaerens TaxID=10228 RepID=B3RIH6_TRIAD|nr:hypothetical protein TRIADDRAFT_18643 [Trichoplax adhaerens]EDV29236.1 hypothetical protein TRIADDRAFT_18643 [Trichoplax adhaerens]|eukprot:XP_002108438.1 hypothetical protein TRIADDRAFT_18643 [Trichoplax adhaerens]